MYVRELACFLLACTALPAPVVGQRTGDLARLTFTIFGGFVGSTGLWSVPRQPVAFIEPADTLQLSRSTRQALTVGFTGGYFPHEHLGFTAEAHLLGVGFKDSCSHHFTSGSPDVAAVCSDIDGRTKPSTAVVLSGGLIYRIAGRSFLSPYARGNAGFVFSTQSSLRTIGQFPSDSGLVDLTVYADDKNVRVHPAFALGVGITAAVSKGYQLRWEVRDNIAGIQTVTGPAEPIRTVPPHKLVFKHLFSLTLGLDIILERKRGRRY
jgi:hypothetical protein